MGQAATHARRGTLEVVVLCTRDVGGRTTGRVVVLRSHLEALQRLGHCVRVVVVSSTPPREGPWTERFPTTHVRAPGAASMALGAAGALLRPFLRRRPGRLGGPTTLNECFFVDARVRREVAEAAAGADVVVADGLRLATAAAGVAGARWVVDLDDLLSDRYQRVLERVRSGRSAAADVLGIGAERLPGSLRRPAAHLAVRLLALESRRARAREVEVARSADAVSLVSPEEAAQLSSRAGVPVAWLPPAVEVPETPVEEGDGLVFLGGLDYGPNADAVKVYRDEVLPRLRELRGPATPVLHLVGHCPPELRRELEVPGIVVDGFVDDLAAALRRRALVAPLQDPGGVKLKVLDAFAAGLPVVGTPQAFTGTALPDRLRCGAPDGPGLADALQRILDDPPLRRRLADGARDHAARTFTSAAGADRWAAVLGALVSARDHRA